MMIFILKEIYTKKLFFYVYKETIYREIGDDGMLLFRKTKEHYQRLYPTKEFKIIVKWYDDTHVFNKNN